MIPNYNGSQLEEILETEISVPAFLDEKVFLHEFKNNHRLRWRINYFLYKKEALVLLLNPSDFRRWIFLKQLNRIMYLVVLGFLLYERCYWILAFLVLHPLMVSSIHSHRRFILFALLAAISSFIFQFNAADFWIAFTATTLGYLLNKSMANRIDQVIIEKAFMNIHSFWKYYSKKLILVEPFVSNIVFVQLVKKYPELIDDP